MSLAYLILWVAGYHMAGLIVGVIVLDLGHQAMHIGNLARILNLVEGARSRVNTIYMIFFFLGGAAGSGLSTAQRSQGGHGTIRELGGLGLGRDYRRLVMKMASTSRL